MQATKSKAALNEPKGQRLFEIDMALSHVHVASYILHTLPCLNIKLTAVKVILKDQQTLNVLINPLSKKGSLL